MTCPYLPIFAFYRVEVFPPPKDSVYCNPSQHVLPIDVADRKTCDINKNILQEIIDRNKIEVCMNI